MTRYHFSPKTKKAEPCTAQYNCDYGDTEHIDNPTQADLEEFTQRGLEEAGENVDMFSVSTKEPGKRRSDAGDQKETLGTAHPSTVDSEGVPVQFSKRRSGSERDTPEIGGFTVNPDEPESNMHSRMHREIALLESDIRKNGDMSGQKREELEQKKASRREKMSATVYDQNPEKKIGKEFKQIRKEWADQGLRGIKNMSPEEQRIIDSTLSITNSSRYRSGNNFYQAQTSLLHYRPHTTMPRKILETELTLDHETGNIYQVDSYWQGLGNRFFGKPAAGTVYRVTNHGQDLSAATQSAEEGYKSNADHLSGLLGEDIEYKKSPFYGFSTHEDYEENPFTGNEKEIIDNLKEGMEKRRRLFDAWDAQDDAQRQFS